jgi:hypothetical protein
VGGCYRPRPAPTRLQVGPGGPGRMIPCRGNSRTLFRLSMDIMDGDIVEGGI